MFNGLAPTYEKKICLYSPTIFSQHLLCPTHSFDNAQLDETDTVIPQQEEPKKNQKKQKDRAGANRAEAKQKQRQKQ